MKDATMGPCHCHGQNCDSCSRHEIFVRKFEIAKKKWKEIFVSDANFLEILIAYDV
jgi:hypothetical protein